MFLKVIILHALFFPHNVQGALSNTCSNWLGYIFPPIFPTCFYNPDVFSNTIAIIERYLGEGSYENYTVTTKDGYILRMFRILQENPKGVVMLQHPITADGNVWVQDGINRSMAFNLHAMGYEVWLPNHRGTYYSEKHVNLSINSLEYWQFSFHEIGIYDYTSFIEKISEVSNSNNIIFVGHSMSSTSGLVYSSLLPDHAAKYLKGMILMSPVTYLKHFRGLGRFLLSIFPILKDVLNLVGTGGLFTKNSFSEALVRSATYAPIKPLLIFSNEFVSGPSNFDPKIATFFFSQYPRGTGINTINHYSQIYKNYGDFRMYDFGSKQNIKKYKSKIAPEYPLENINIPIYLVASKDDYVATVKDTEILYSHLPETAKKYGKFYTGGLDHIDFFYGKDRYDLALNHVLKFIDNM